MLYQSEHQYTPVQKAAVHSAKFNKSRVNTSNANMNDVKLQVDRAILNYKRKVASMDKRFYIAATDLGVAQVSANSSGHQAIDVTPTPQQDSSDNGRIGREIQLSKVSVTIQMMPYRPDVFQHEMGFRYDLWLVKGAPISVSQAANFYEQGVSGASAIDTNSIIDRDYTSSMQAVRLSSLRSYMKAPSFLSSSTTESNTHASVSKTIKLKHKVKFNGDTQTVTGGQLILVCLADSGNRSSTASTLTVPNSAPFSDAAINYSCKYNYSD
jgi:hypothetical protein